MTGALGFVTVADGASLELEGNVSQSSSVYSSGTYYYPTIDGAGGVRVTAGATATLEGTNSYTGGTVIETGAVLTSFALKGETQNDGKLIGYGTVNGNIEGTGSVENRSGYTLVLTGVNSYEGTTRVKGGGIIISTTAGIPGDVVIETANSLLRFDQTVNGAYAGDISGAGTLAKYGAGTMVLTGQSNHTGGTTIGGGALEAATANLSGNVNISTTSARFRIRQEDAGILAGNISGMGGIVKLGQGDVTLAGTNSFAAGTLILDGSLIAGDSSAFGSGTVRVEGGSAVVAEGVALSNQIVLAGGSLVVNLSAGKSLAAHTIGTNGIGTTTAGLMAGTLSQASAITTAYAPTSATSNDGTRQSDVFSLHGTGSDAFVLKLTSELVDEGSRLAWADPASGTWRLAVNGNTDAGALAGFYEQSWETFVADNGGSFDAGVMLGAYGTDSAGHSVWAVINHNSNYAAAAVPEPGTLSLLALGLLPFLRRRRVTQAGNKHHENHETTRTPHRRPVERHRTESPRR